MKNTSTNLNLEMGLEPCPEQLSEQQVQRFENEGYLAFREVLSPQEVEGARLALSDLVRRFVEQTSAGVTNIPYDVEFEAGYQPEAGDLAYELKVRKLMWFTPSHPLLQFFAESQPHIHITLNSLIGQAHIMFQDMALVKPPLIGSEKPWHQDNAYFAVEPLEAICGVWIALDDATVENGCMHVLPDGHKLGAFRHIHAADCEIPSAKLDLSKVIPIEIPAGGAMFFKGMLPHQTPPNSSPDRRRALQLHYRSADSRVVTREEYDVIYSELDKSSGQRVPASCAAASPKVRFGSPLPPSFGSKLR